MNISAAESKVMEALWKREPLSADEIVAEVASANGWSTATVKTLLIRLHKKKAVSRQKTDRLYVYRALLSRADHMSTEGRNVIDRLFGGRVSSLVMHFSEREQLSKEDLADLKRLIAELDDER
jgi:BlaI family transcriptional regulator, penicillinase repressor